MPLKWHICQLILIQKSDNSVSIYTSYAVTVINNETMSIGIHKFHIIHVCLPHYICMFHCTYIVLYFIQTPHYHICKSKQQQTTTFNFHAITIYVATTSMPLKGHICLLLQVQILENYTSIHTSYELTPINNVTRTTGIHTCHIIGICPWTNIPATLHTLVQLQF